MLQVGVQREANRTYVCASKTKKKSKILQSFPNQAFVGIVAYWF